MWRGESERLQDLDDVVGVFVGLGEEAEGDCRDGVVAPGFEEGDEEGLAALCGSQYLERVKGDVELTLASQCLSFLRRSSSCGAVIRLLFR